MGYSCELEVGALTESDKEFLSEIAAKRQSGAAPKKPLVFVSLGTQARQPAYFNEDVVDALGLLDVTVVLQLCSGTTMTAEELAWWREKVPMNFVVYSALKPHALMMHVLHEADLFVSHVGRNTLMEGISQGVPILA